MILSVVEETVSDGFRHLQLSVVQRRPPRVDPGDADASLSARKLITVVPWEGTHRLSAEPDAPRFIDCSDPVTPVDPDQAAPSGTRCHLEILNGFDCSCEEDPMGPRRCARTASNGTKGAMLTGLGILTLGITWMLGATPRGGSVTELRLIETDRGAIETTSLLQPPRQRRRRGR